MVAAERLHQPVLQRVDVLELVDHHVFESPLPLLARRLVRVEDVQHQDNQVVVVQPEAFLLLPQVAVEDDVVGLRGGIVFGAERSRGHRHEVRVVARLGDGLADLDHVARLRECHVAQREPALFVDHPQHRVDVGVVQHQEAFRILYGVAVLLKHGDAEAVEGVDERGVVVADKPVDAAAHLRRRLVRECHAEDVGRQNAHRLHEVGEPARQGARLARAGAGDDAHVALGRLDGHALLPVEVCGDLFHAATPPAARSPSPPPRRRCRCLSPQSTGRA